MAVLEVKGLTVGFSQKPLVENLSARIQPPAFVAIVGHNGCGKSTFFRCLTGQHSYIGSIEINGEDITRIKNIPVRGLITLLEQKNHVNFNIKVIDLVLMGRFRFKKLFEDYSQKDFQLAQEALELLKISHLEDEEYLLLSGGEQQLVWLAQLIVQDAEIVLLDEPTQQLDVYNRKRVFDLMQDWAYKRGKTILCITHDLGNLPGLNGYILNLSRPDPSLNVLNDEQVEEELRYLEVKPVC